MAKKVLITGVNGFLGSSLWKHIKAGHSSVKVYGLDRQKTASSRQIYQCDLNNQSKLVKVLSRIRPDTIFHLAGGRVNADTDLFKNNVTATKALFDAVGVINNYRPRIIIPGSAAEYGKPVPSDKPIKETMPERPVSFYGFVKHMQTSLGLMYMRGGMDIVVARVFNVCGYGMPPSLSLGQFSKQIALIEKGKKRPVLQTHGLGFKRDFLDVEDVCSAFWAIAQYGKSGAIYNVCSGRSYYMRDLLKKLVGFVPKLNVDIKEGRQEGRGVDISVGSNTKVKKATGWSPKCDISQSLKNTLSYYRKTINEK